MSDFNLLLQLCFHNSIKE